MMRHLLLMALTVFLVGTSPAAPPVDLKGKTLKQTFEELLPGMTGRESQQKWQDICLQVGAPGNEALRAEACKLMADKLAPETPKPTRIWLLRQLELIGRAEAVDAVAALLDDREEIIRDAALRCLTGNPAPEATRKLLARLASAEKGKVGLINALGQRGDPAVGEAVAKELTGSEPALVIAAARALGRMGGPEAVTALRAARGKAEGQVRRAISDAYLLQADRLLAQGKAKEAEAIYRELNRTEEPRPIRLAALQGVLKSAGDEAGTMVLSIFAGDDLTARAIAASAIDSLSAGSLRTLASSLEKLPPESQALVLRGLAARGEKSQLPVVLSAAKSANETVRRAAIRALGRLGDASVVSFLVETLLGSPNLAGDAADSLVLLAGEEVNEKLLTVMASEKSPVRVVSIMNVLERRKATSAVPALLRATGSDNVEVRAGAFAALRGLAEPKHLPEMIQALLRTGKGKDREQAEQAILTVCNQVTEADRRAEPLLAVLNPAKTEDAVLLLPLVGRIGGTKARDEVRKLMRTDGKELREAAIRALHNWPDPSVSDDLLSLAKDAQQRSASLQALVRIHAAQSVDRPQEQRLATLAALRKGMELATTLDEKKQILEGLGMARHIETFRYVLPYLDERELAQSACKAIVDLAHSRMLREPNQEEFNRALDRVIRMCKDKGLVARARQYREGR